MKRRLLTIFLVLNVVGMIPGHAMAQSQPDAIYILAPGFQQGYWWDHTTLTVNIRANGNVDPNFVAATYDAISIWNSSIAPVVQFVDVTGDRRAAAQADVVLNLHAQGGAKLGVALCQSDRHCQVPVWDGERANDNAWVGANLAYEDLVWLVVHELGHVLGLGHAEPLYGTTDVMGYGDLNGAYPSPVLSACDLAAFNYVWAWAINGETPHPPADDVFPCS